jgi:hypothetical protein
VALSAGALALIAWSTLRAQPASPAAQASACCSPFDLLLNALLFVPLGSGVALLGLRWRAAVVVGVCTSVAIELSQLWWMAGRFASVPDVVANLSGAVLGAMMVSRWGQRARWWRMAAPVVAAVVVIAWFVGAHLAQPAIPGPSPWRVERGAAAADEAPSGARVLEASLQGIPLPDGALADLPALRALLSASDTTRLVATAVTGLSSGEPRQLMEIVVGEGAVPFLILAREGRTLLAYQRLGLSWVGLRGPWLRLDNALPPHAGDTVHIRLEATRRHLRLAATADGVEYESYLTLSPDLYLSALLHRATDGVLWWALAPAMISFGLLGLALAGHPRLLIALGLVALFLSSNRAGCAYPEWPVVAVAMAGALGGWRLGRAIGLVRV